MKYTFERTTDPQLVKRILTSPEVWSRIADDFAGKPEDFEPAFHPATGYVLVRQGEEICGMWTFNAENEINWWAHTALLRNAWGKRARVIAREALAWIWSLRRGERWACYRLTMNIARSNWPALKMAREMGFEEFGRNEKSVMRNGQLEDQVLLGLSRPEE